MTSDPTPPADARTGLGVELREGRLARGLTLADAQRATHIPRRYLEAMENENFVVLPAPVFARGFLSSYAQYLGLEPAALLARFPSAPPEPGALPIAGVPADELERGRTARPDGLKGIPTIDTRTPSVRLGPWLVAAFVALVVLAGVVAVVAFGDDELSGTAAGPTSTGNGDLATDAAAAAQSPVISLETMPNLRERTLADALTILRRAGLPFVVVEVHDAAVVGTMLDQTPLPSTALSTRSTVTLVVSLGPATLPADEQAQATEP